MQQSVFAKTYKPCLFFLLIMQVLSCKTENVVRRDYKIPKATIVNTSNKDELILRVGRLKRRPDFIAYSDLSVAEVCTQIAAVYHKRYVKFIKVNSREIGPLGGGHTDATIQLSALLYELSSEGGLYLHARKDTIIVEKNIPWPKAVVDSAK